MIVNQRPSPVKGTINFGESVQPRNRNWGLVHMDVRQDPHRHPCVHSRSSLRRPPVGGLRRTYQVDGFR